ncbi:MAG: hypothetical protein H6574_11480 [Lewinellaceae bacterium]|nr:hypothetical protein [Saprospiraceae bacterium]MCB9331696.1 hypothetical protein [Lewinellaceae bacterium]
MNKPLRLALCLLALPFILNAQSQTWHKRIGPNAFNATMCALVPDGDHFLVYTDKFVFEMDQLGAVPGYFKFGSSTAAKTTIFKKYDPVTGDPYFIVLYRPGISSKDYILAEYRPGIGFVNQKVFQDSIGIYTLPKPQCIEVSDNSFIVFGRKLYRKINYDRTTGFTQEWARNTGAVWPIAVARHNNLLILADEKGQLQALDADGNQVWLRNHTTQFRALKVLPDGFVGCGIQSNGVPIVLRMDFDGQEMWSAGYPGTIFLDIIRTSDGGYAVTGLSDGSEINLMKLDAQGGFVWSRNYGNADNVSGGGCAILELPDGGFFLLARGKTAVHCIRTDALGNAPDPELIRVDYRQLKNSALQGDFFPGPGLFFDGFESTFLALEDTSSPTIIAFAPWIAGKDATGELRLAAADYQPSGIPDDYRAGSAGTPEKDFNRVWAVNRAEIRRLREDYRLDKTLDAPVPFDLLTWPGKGNPHFRYNLDFSPVQTDPGLFPAPFIDANADGLYNVYDGDYPDIQGDQMLWWAFTDSTLHEQTDANPLVVDFQVSAYTYDCGQNPLLEKTLFVDYTVINRAGATYAESYLGFFADPDLGCFQDDYIGSAPQADAWYVYNADALDEDCFGYPGFGDAIPVQSVQFLNHSLDHAMYFTNPSVSQPPAGTTDPNLPLEYYWLLNGLWRDGTPLTRGGSGYNPGSTDTVSYIFPDNPPDLQGWTMCTESLPYADRRMLTSHGPFNFGAADTFRMEVAFTRHSNIPHPCPDLFGLVVPPLQQLKQWQNNGALDLASSLAPVYTIGIGQTLNLDASVAAGTATYAWSTGSTESTVSITAPGNYTVTITGETGCTQVEALLVQSGVSTGEPELPEWKLWPNPATEQLFIRCPECDAPGTRALLYNAQGLLVRQQAGLSGAMNVRNLPAGVYWLELRDARGWLGVKRVAVVR